MNLSVALARQFNAVFLSRDWVSTTSLKEQLESITWQQAASRFAGLNSIADLARHLDYYISGIIRVLESGVLDMHDAESFSFSPIQSQQEWHLCLASLWNHASTFESLVTNLNKEEIEAPFANTQYGSNYHNINAMVQHIYYHLGQIVIIKKLLTSTT